MRIDRIDVQNFKKFGRFALNLHPQFTLLVGANGAGKTTVLDALAVALGVWLVEAPDSSLVTSRRGIAPSEIRLLSTRTRGDRPLFHEALGGVWVRATGQISDANGIEWAQRIKEGGRRTSNVDAAKALAIIKSLYSRISRDEEVLLPVLAYYGAGRAWLPHRSRGTSLKPQGKPKRWDAFYDCLNDRIRLGDLVNWFQDEAIAAVNRRGRVRPGFEVVRYAVLRCVPGAEEIWYDGDLKDVVLSISGNPQPFENLSAGQRMMLAMVADIAIKAVVQNNHLVTEDNLFDDATRLPRVLAETSGVVLIDELDVHLHPKWQRIVAKNLKETFPQLQFVCTSHSPQVIGELPPNEIRILDDPRRDPQPSQSFGLDSNAILDYLMDSESRTGVAGAKIQEIEDLIENGDLDRARHELQNLRQIQFGETRDTAALEAELGNLEALIHAEDP